MIVTWLEIAQIAYNAGFRGEALRDAIALSQPESGRKSDARNTTDPNGGSFGLWQINGIHDPNATGTAPNKVPTQAWIDKMFIPAENAKVAFNVWSNNGKSFNPWGAYTSELHKPYQALAAAIMYAREQLALCNSFIVARNQRISELELAISTLTGTISNREETISGLRVTVDERDQQVASLTGEKQLLQGEILRLNNNISQAVQVLT